MSFAENLRQLRLREKLTQNEVSDAIGVSSRVYAYYEDGRLPKEDVILEIGKFFNVSIDMLFGNYRNYLKFYYDTNCKKYVYCKRPCYDNMSLVCFEDNGELSAYASENYDTFFFNKKTCVEVKEVTWDEFAHDFIKPIIKENYRLKKLVDKIIKE